MDVCARGLKAAAAMLEDGGLEKMRVERYAGWKDATFLDQPLETIAARVEAEGIEPQPRSGGQERLENWVSRFV
jgi:xylose isomerase